MPEVVKGSRTKDAERTKAEIIDAATVEFAALGYAGARVDEVASNTSTTKRMIYYYFGSKEGLFLAVLERAYRQIRETEQQLDVKNLEPIAAMRALAERSFDHHAVHQDFVRLVSIENINEARFLRRIESISSLSTPIVKLVGEILHKGRASGAFRDDVDAVDVHMLISAYCVFPGASGHTFAYLFDRDLRAPSNQERYRRMIGDIVVAWLCAR